ncbi:MAG: ectoine/hydroxyectoine ABC transporter substrate-binding protein EhuB [Propionibacteriales bacterium]|nr:ectoine/hydroxyectoine ABC transporter substrate-binding protein EhuB [Propionibacteriales bacterium]
MLAGGIVVAPGLLAACERTGTNGATEGGRLEELRSQGTIQVGIAGEEPYGYLDGGDLTGMDPTVQQEIWGNLGIDEVQATQVDFDGLIPGLNAGRFDVVAAGMFITPERCAEAAFSDPMYCAPNAFLVAPGNPLNITDFQSIADADAKLVVLGGAVEGQYAQEAGVSGGNITRVGGARDGLLQLEQGRVDAFGLTTITLKDILNKNPDSDVELTEAFTPVVDGEEQLGCGGAVFAQEDTALVDAFNEELANLRESGRLLELIEPFGFGPETQEDAERVTTEQLCGAG